MGMLLNRTTGERIVLRATHVFGRDTSRSDTCLSDLAVSAIHAVARWKGRWLLADHSRNGTYLDDKLLPRSELTPLQPGQVLRFGRGPSSVLHVLDLAPPCTMLLPMDGSNHAIRLERSNLLPLGEPPSLSIYQDNTGAWLLESESEPRALNDGDAVRLNGRLYRFVLQGDLEGTLDDPPSPVEPSRLAFHLSLDEEHTRMHVQHGPRKIDLGERSHHYCLVTLARRRLADAQQAFDPDAQGWTAVSDLARMLGLDVSHVNIQIFRARNQLMAAVPDSVELTDIIQRRRGEVRLGNVAFDIHRGSQLEGSLQIQAQYVPTVLRR
ncbi:MAG: FHA domain-containing protein [Pseudomonadota bacterium]